ncbi:aminoglycoside phosphotransferase family protein [Aliikangiella sp. G2MR2-5]|uniref:aminoglycoside phosphotransferase family protein n=1 Tax=Aliikangiella sp. G2MR2-5 TaxID=2788943 RepID=UPI001AEE3C19|nr:phosphotransferase [Aliikangiella sp. G2MR2-5]
MSPSKDMPFAQKQLLEREQQLAVWAAAQLAVGEVKLTPVSGDASFRRYFRIFQNNGKTLIAVDSPPQQEDNQAFFQIAMLLKKYHLNVPEFIHCNFEDGFLLISDLGDELLLPALNEHSVDNLYSQAIDVLIQFQQIPAIDYDNLPAYDATLLEFEMSLFRDWFVDKHLKLQLTTEEERVIESTFDLLTINALEQPQSLVHRDFHSRNLMILKDKSLAIIDFQGAVNGPVSYDLVSLLKDCYIQWPEPKVREWSHEYWQRAIEAGLLEMPFEDFYQYFEWMGMQRHIKVLGIFCRLFYRDKKSSYLNDLPLTFQYLEDAAKRYPEFKRFTQLLTNKIAPALAIKSRGKN